MAAQFRPGDLVVCVDITPLPEWVQYLGDPLYVATRLCKGGVYRVSRVGVSRDGGTELQLLGVEPAHKNRGFGARRFRKIDKADEGFTAWMKAMRPKQKARCETPYYLNLEGERG